jgi:hypothetical protein
LVCTMISQTTLYGDARYESIASDLTLTFGKQRVWAINASVSGLSIILPVKEKLPLGGPLFYVLNAGRKRLTVKDADEVGQIQIERGEAVVIHRSK